MVVFFRQMAEPHVAQETVCMLGDGLGAVVVVQMARATGYAHLQMLRIRTLQEHLAVVVSLDDQIIGACDVGSNLVGHLTDIGNQTERRLPHLNHIAHVVAAVVGHVEGRHPEVAHLQADARLDVAALLHSHLARYAVVAVDAFVHQPRGIDGQVKLVADAAHTLDVVGMVVGDQNVVHPRQAEPVVSEMLFQPTDAHAGINQEAVVFCI